jgi:thiamine-phosphate pyrophosphorylase
MLLLFRAVMTPDVTPAVARALDEAAALASAAAADAVRPLHLLHGLLREEEGQAGTLAAAAGLDWERYRSAQPAPPTPATPDPVPLPLDDESRAVLSLARELAPDLTGEATVSSAALLLALVRAAPDAVAALSASGLDAARLERALLAGRPEPLRLDEPLRLPDLTEQVDTARVLDAAANRAREALRVAEDYCRFVLDDALLTAELKELRHGLREALAELPAGLLVSARDTDGDVGTGLATEAEGRRGSALEVAQAAFKRLQEALRSLEEFGKVHGADLGRALEGLRYRSYTLERAVVLGVAARQRLADARLCVLLSGAGCALSLADTVRLAAAGGADLIQLREKGPGDRELLARARSVRRWTRQAGVLFIVNDRPDIARLAEADGVHLGQDDLSVRDARRILGPDALVGVSTHDPEQVRRAVRDGASYLGVGPVFPSGTKEFGAFPGLEFVRAAAAATTLPAFAIGGVGVANVGQVVAAGLRRVAVSGAVARSDDPQAVAAALRRVLG